MQTMMNFYTPLKLTSTMLKSTAQTAHEFGKIAKDQNLRPMSKNVRECKTSGVSRPQGWTQFILQCKTAELIANVSTTRTRQLYVTRTQLNRKRFEPTTFTFSRTDAISFEQ